MSRLHRELSAYLALPFYPGERDYYEEVNDATRSLETRVASFVAGIGAGDAASALSSFREGIAPACSRLDQALERLVTFNAGQERRLGTEIPAIRARSDRVGAVLEGAAALFGLTLMLLAVREARRYRLLLEERRQLAEERAAAAVVFSTRTEFIAKAMVRIADAITEKLPLRATYGVVVDEARTVVGADYCAIGLGSDPERPFEPWSFSGMAAADAEAIGKRPRPVGLLAAVQHEGKPVRLANLTKHPAFRGLPEHHPALGPFLGIPLVHRAAGMGTLYLARKVGRPAFTEDDERAAGLLATYVAVAADNARLYGDARVAVLARDELVAVVSHDLKNPLNAVRLTTDLLRRSVGEGRSAELVARLDRAASRMLEMISNLLDAAKVEAGQLSVTAHPEDTQSLLDEAVEMFDLVAADKSIALVRQAPRSPVAVSCDRALLLRVLSNLIGNALEIARRRREPYRSRPRRSMKRSLLHQGQRKYRSAADQIDHVFDRYWQQKDAERRGNGLGLYIAKGIVDAHGGRIWVESKLGGGSTFHFALPALRGASGQAGAGPA